MRLFFLTIPKPLKQHPILKKIIHSAHRAGGSLIRRQIFKNLEEKISSLSIYIKNGRQP